MSELGELLQQARAYKGVTLREAERTTRISRQYLSALETQDFSLLPPAAYARGIVRNYATYLGLDPATALKLYEEESGAPAEKHEVVPAIPEFEMRSHWAPNFAIIAFMVVISAIVFAWMYSAYFQRPEALATRTIGIPTVTPVETSIMAVTTVQTQGGGSATVTPTIVASPSPSASPTEELLAAAETVDDAAATEADSQPTEAAAIGDGSHAFVIWAHEDVWVDVVLDGEAVFSQVIAAGGEQVFYGDSVSITSGNAMLVQLWIDGVDYGDLGDSWDATFNYP